MVSQIAEAARLLKDDPAHHGLFLLFLFLLVASAAWFITLSTLLIRWISIGCPRYPGQVNPVVPFISDIAAFTFKAVFVAGCAVTAVAYFGTVLSVHLVRYSPHFYGLTDDTRWRKGLSLVALLFGLAASTCLFLLSIFDTVDSNVWHRYLLLGTFAGLAVSALATTVVWWDQTWSRSIFVHLRRWQVA